MKVMYLYSLLTIVINIRLLSYVYLLIQLIFFNFWILKSFLHLQRLIKINFIFILNMMLQILSSWSFLSSFNKHKKSLLSHLIL